MRGQQQGHRTSRSKPSPLPLISVQGDQISSLDGGGGGGGWLVNHVFVFLLSRKQSSSIKAEDQRPEKPAGIVLLLFLASCWSRIQVLIWTL